MTDFPPVHVIFEDHRKVCVSFQHYYYYTQHTFLDFLREIWQDDFEIKGVSLAGRVGHSFYLIDLVDDIWWEVRLRGFLIGKLKVEIRS